MVLSLKSHPLLCHRENAGASRKVHVQACMLACHQIHHSDRAILKNAKERTNTETVWRGLDAVKITAPTQEHLLKQQLLRPPVTDLGRSVLLRLSD